MMLGSAVALIVGMWINLDMMYRDGAIARVSFFKIWVSNTAFRRLENWLYHPMPPDLLRMTFMGGGMVLTLILFVLRMRFFGGRFTLPAIHSHLAPQSIISGSPFS